MSLYDELCQCLDPVSYTHLKDHPKADVFNEALNTARVEATGLDIPCVKEVSQVDGKWAILIEYKEGTTLEEMMDCLLYTSTSSSTRRESAIL